MDLIIEGHPSELEWLRREIDRELGTDANLEAVPSQASDELREPIIISLIVSLGGPALVTGLVQILKRRYEHREAMRSMEVDLRRTELAHEYAMTELRLRVVDDDGKEREIPESELEALAG